MKRVQTTVLFLAALAGAGLLQAEATLSSARPGAIWLKAASPAGTTPSQTRARRGEGLRFQMQEGQLRLASPVAAPGFAAGRVPGGGAQPARLPALLLLGSCLLLIAQLAKRRLRSHPLF